MEYTVLDKGPYKLHLIKTNKFKTIKFRIFMRSRQRREEITLRNFLMDILTYSTKSYKTRKDLVRKSQELYAVNIYTRGYRLGGFQTINIFLSLLNEKYTESGMLEESIKLLGDVLFNPNVTDSMFDEESFNMIYKSNKEMIEGIKDQPSKYSLVRMLENMGSSMYSYNEYGYMEDLQKITRRNLYEYYLKLFKDSSVDIYVIGDYDNKKLEELIDKHLKFNTFNKYEGIDSFKHETYNIEPKVIKENESINQSRLSIGCKLIDLTSRERNYVLTIYNLILGGSADSKFFKNIREKYSICYTISSSLDKLDNLLFIKVGISRENFDLCLDRIKSEMNDIESGNISDDDIDNAKKTYLALLNDIVDNDEAIIDTYVSTDVLGVGDIETRKKEISTVTKEEIVNLSKKIKMDTIYLLEGSEVDGEN